MVANAWAFATEPGRITVCTLDGTREEKVPPVDHYQRVAAFARMCARAAASRAH